MPRIWADTIDSHRRQVHDAILDATAELMAEVGPMSVAMSAVAERAGIGRATLYKYFPDVESILVAWHARDFHGHLQHLEALSESDTVTLDKLIEFVQAQRRHHGHGHGAAVAGSVSRAIAGFAGAIKDAIEPEVISALTRLLTRLRRRKEIRTDHDPELLARWLLHAVHVPADLDDAAVADLLRSSLAPTQKARRQR